MRILHTHISQKGTRYSDDASDINECSRKTWPSLSTSTVKADHI